MGKYYGSSTNRFMVEKGQLRPVDSPKHSASTKSATLANLKPDYGTNQKDSYVLQGKRAAPAGRFRLLGVDTFSGPFSDFLVGDFNEKEEAMAEATKRAGQMKPMYVYDDTGALVFSVSR